MPGPTNDTKNLIEYTVGAMGLFQIMVTILVLILRVPTCMHQVIILLHAPPVGDFWCSDTNLSSCDPDCPKHEFDHEIWEKTIVHEWDLVCDRHFYVSYSQSLVMLGMLVGNITFGFLSDRFGRRLPVAVAVTIQAISGMLIACAPWFWLYAFLRFTVSVATGGSMLSMLCILIEFTSRKYRPLMGLLFALPCQVAFASMGIIGYYVRRWDYIQVIVSSPTVACLLCVWIILPESPRWLLTMGQYESVTKLLEKTARFNRMPTEHIRHEVEVYVERNPPEEENSGGNFLLLFNTRRMLTKTVLLSLNWMVISMDFFSIAQYMGTLSGNMFLNILSAGLIQIPGILGGYFLIDKLGRKFCLLTGYIFILVPMLTISILNDRFDPKWISSTMTCVSLTGGALCFSILMIYAGELYPTVVRSIGLGFSCMFGQIGSIIAPFLLELNRVDTALPPTIIGLLPIIPILLTYFFLPETKDMPLANTVEEANHV